MFSSFTTSNLMQAARILPDVPQGLLAVKGWPGLWALKFSFTLSDYVALHPEVSDVSLRQVQRVHRLKCLCARQDCQRGGRPTAVAGVGRRRNLHG